jgi:hypothetical protein
MLTSVKGHGGMRTGLYALDRLTRRYNPRPGRGTDEYEVAGLDKNCYRVSSRVDFANVYVTMTRKDWDLLMQ